MLKKLVIAGLAIAVGLAAVCLLNEKIRSWVAMQFQQGNQNLEDLIDPDQEIARLEFEIGNLEKQKPVLYDNVAKQAVEVDKLQDKFDGEAKDVASLKDEVKALVRALEADPKADTVSVALKPKSKDVSRKDANTQLKIDNELLESLQKQHKATGNLLEKQRDNLGKAKEMLASQETNITELRAEVAQLKSEWKSVQMQEATNAVAEKDSASAKVRADISKLKDKIKVREKKQELAKELHQGQGPLHDAASDEPKNEQDNITKAKELSGESGDKASADKPASEQDSLTKAKKLSGD